MYVHGFKCWCCGEERSAEQETCKNKCSKNPVCSLCLKCSGHCACPPPKNFRKNYAKAFAAKKLRQEIIQGDIIGTG